ncbi:hypothetical protein [Treponema brennaborense]|uniref:Band 7 domain-containing protein n=1 Tax=Treponema brennaborense (strain DSM 12168 / CIP 105900 / DD5/3) TaxID=906968 RepID=F4LMP8_TREBD|nr:hypothetical protein [Treponema brennaborense]AEE16795.1 hypothetical protein Trebr_1371 [Treponema brennaborense DSM 12168]
MKKAIVSLVILLLAAGTVFYFGWIQFSVPVGSCGVMISKTGGVHSEPIRAGTFTWRWERLLPTNTQLRTFSLAPLSVTETVSGTLPSADVYRIQLAEKPDFSYSITFRTTARIKPETVVSLVERNDIREQAELDEYVRTQINRFNAAAAELILGKTQEDPHTFVVQAISSDELIAGTNAATAFPDVEITSVSVQDVKVPDAGLYLLAKTAFTEYQRQVNEKLAAQIDKKVSVIFEDNRQFENLVTMGKILTEYPVLVTYLAANGNDIGKALSAIEAER